LIQLSKNGALIPDLLAATERGEWIRIGAQTFWLEKKMENKNECRM